MILVVDIETTGFLQQGGKIVEIGIVSLDLETGEVKDVFSSVCHERPITREEVEKSWIINNSSLTVDCVRNSPKLEDIRQEVQAIIDSYPEGITAYNNKFDFSFLEDRGFRMGKKLACPMLVGTDIIKLPGKGSGYKWPSVEEAWAHFFPDEPYVEEHRGLDDARHEAKIIMALNGITGEWKTKTTIEI